MRILWNLCWVLAGMMLISFPVHAVQITNHTQAYDQVVMSECKGSIEGLAIYASQNVLPAGYVIKSRHQDFVTLDQPRWFVFIDDHPAANWGHSSRYVLIDPETGKTETLKSNWPPDGYDKMIRMSGPDVFGGKNVQIDTPVVRKISNGRSPDNLYAVILSGGADSSNNHVRYWNDCSEIYKTLTQVYGYLDENIIVAISDGTNPAADQSNGQNSDPDLDNDGDDDTMYACTRANLTTIFGNLAATLGGQDSLFIFTTDHGDGQYGTPGQPTSQNLWNWEEIWDYEFADLLEPIQCREIILTLEPCFSGGFVNDVVDMNSTVPRVISTAANDHEYSWAMGPDYVYDTYVYHWTGAVRGAYPGGAVVDADTNNDGEVTMDEAYAYALANDADDEHPQYGEWPAGYGATLSLFGSGMSSEGYAKIDRTTYNCADSILVTVEDIDLVGTGTLQVSIVSTTEVTPEPVSLTEIEDGLFEGSIATGTGAPSADGVLQVANLDNVTLTYHDMHYGDEGEQDVTDTAGIDCVAPQITGVTVTQITFESALVSWTTNETATSSVEYGLTTGLGSATDDSHLMTSHQINLSDLDDCSTYYFQVVSYDEAGNQVIDNNGGMFYNFTTYELFTFLDEPLDTSPGWTIEGQWAYGVPLGAGGDPTSGHTGPNVYGYNLAGAYPNNMPEYHLTTTAFDCSTASGTTLSFWRWLGLESSSYDHAYIRISTNGTTWTNVWSHNQSTFQDTEWLYFEYDISSYADGQSTVYLRWTMGTSDVSITGSGWNIDDIRVFASQPCGLETPTMGPSNTPTPPGPTFTPTPPPGNTNTPTVTSPPTSTSVPPTYTSIPPTSTMAPTYTPTMVPPTSTYTPTRTPTRTPTATNTPVPATNTPLPSETPPDPTETPEPTNTPTEPVPATNTPEPSATPTTIPDKGMELVMADTDLAAGEMFILDMYIHNPESQSYSADAYVLLGIAGDYWCWPSWVEINHGLDKKSYTVDPESSYYESILSFEWPPNISAMSGLSFIGCLFEAGSWNIIGTPQIIPFGCH